jgi:CRP-like cAMP-binding protein
LLWYSLLPQPPFLLDLASFLDFINLDIFGYVPMACLGSESGLTRGILMTLLMPVAMLSIFAFYYGTFLACQSLSNDDSKANAARVDSDTSLVREAGTHLTSPQIGGSPKGRMSVSMGSMTGPKQTKAQMNQRWYAHFQAFVHFMMFTHLTYTKTFISYFKCEKMSDGKYHLVSDMHIICFEGQEWLDTLPFVILGAIVFVLGLPLWYLYICKVGRRRGFQFGTTDRSYFVRKVLKHTGEMEDGGKEKLQALVSKHDANNNNYLTEHEFDSLLNEIGMELSNIQREQQMIELGAVKDDELDEDGTFAWKINCSAFERVIASDHSTFDAKFRPVWLKFSSKYPWWDCFLALQTIAIITIQAVFYDTPYFASLLVLYLLFGMFIAQVNLEPFRSKPGNDTAFFCGICILLTMIGGMALAGISEQKDGENKRFQRQTIANLTIAAVSMGAILIGRNAGKELVLNAKEEYRSRMSSAIETIPLFEDCEQAFVADISKNLSKPETHAKGHSFAKIGDSGDCMWIITQGTVSQEDKDGQIVMRTATAEATPAFGGLALMVDEPRAYNFSAETEVTVCTLQRKKLKSSFLKFPSAEDAILTAVLKKYNRTAGVDLSKTSTADLIKILQQNVAKLDGSAKTMAEQKQRIAVDELTQRVSK